MPQSTSKPSKFKQLAISLLATFAMLVLFVSTTLKICIPELFIISPWVAALAIFFNSIAAVFLFTIVFMLTSWEYLVGFITILGISYLMYWLAECTMSSKSKANATDKWLSIGLTSCMLFAIGGYLTGVISFIVRFH